ncbi:MULTISPECIES: YbhB/YbcL family Raf kinase inhibitor-like protein [unclassified Cryobacterium]|uniref:YbhB/YbcL family Raf kinase inhibitor-like protein n=1 Tax=unclassified Cryobacterium TaxID=2649013 RepID=UPI00106913F1|nr:MULTISPECIES: YbhB/YbcL family Raf kinase inhibitor-like protein [unclassified Cryobacterium]MDY7529535.1 YbhB/YbcL family Raf kinase inhibitor-like protein [Cryobacterium sp. 10C2]MDY7558325.1 YbhB/YbcL family Raf kinase inhibitor-like protein [Cryobacterium sp. 10C3]MEB0200871.1 YbhB/YbcL family Raf kinase inhibitor-like protein [Cryobacterium sp. 5I3]MEB0285413.1 YbhB/YbcL family Raf kinase inhibitor-like protein [Cryobacterium sp. 10S3]MEB0291668.1 YbhB/YbcL family Raf kinase inhibitor-
MTTADPLAVYGEVPLFTLSSTDVTDGAPLSAAQFGEEAGGLDRSPQLSWSGFPADTKSFAVTLYDPDAPTGSGFWHWAVFNLPAAVTSLPAGAGAPGGAQLPAGAVTLPNELRLTSFIGAGPPPGTGTHRYQFIVHAVDVPTLDLDPGSTPAVLGFTLRFHTLGRAVIEATGAFGGAALHP